MCINTNPHTQKQNQALRSMPLTVLIFIHVTLLLLFIFFRLIDGDEGIFLRAGQLVQAGQVPYFDFFYMQMPYLPYLLAPISTWGFTSLFLARILVAGLSLASVFMIYKMAVRAGANRNISLLLYFLLIANGLFLTWQTTVKTQVLSDFFGIASFFFFLPIIFTGHPRKNLKLSLFVTGILVGIAINIRSIQVLLLCSELILIGVFLPKGSQKIQTSAMMLLGVLIASTGSLALFIQDPSLFWLHNVSLHQQWGSEIVNQSATIKLMTIAKFILFPQTIILLIPVFFTLRRAVRTPVIEWSDTDRLGMSAILVATLFALFYSTILEPVQLQYFEQTVPFLVLGGLAGWGGIINSEIWRHWKIPILSIYVAGLLPFIMVFLLNYRDNDASNSLKTARTVIRIIEQTCSPGDTILSANTALPEFAKRPIVKGMEVDGRQLLKIVDPEKRNQIQLMDSLTFVNLGRSGRYTIVLFDTTQFPDLSAQLGERYELRGKASSIRIWRKK